MVVMRRFGMNRDQAIAHMQQVADDHAELKEIMADVVATESRPAEGPAPKAENIGAADQDESDADEEDGTTTSDGE
jgi:hypothetical protein